ncbi:MAG: NAD(P)-dependent oxidoreductase [Sarcina sp.]
MTRILFNDGVEDLLKKNLLNLGIEVYSKHYVGEEFIEVLSKCDAVVIRSATKIKKDLIDRVKNTNLKIIIRAGVGTDNIDVEYAKLCGIEVKNTPCASSDSVAELVLAHMFALARHIVQANITMKKGEWNKTLYSGIEISGKTLGIIGMGRIGKSLAKKAIALGMNVIYSDVIEAESYKKVSLDELYAISDFISIHIPTTDILISDEEIEKMKTGVFIINTSRGSVISTEALLVGINNGKIAGAGLDVFDNEPKFSHALVNNPKISATPHIGASTNEAQNRIADEILDIIKKGFNL